MNKITFDSPGKVNLHLAVGEKRADGFHGLDSIFAALGFADTLTFSLLPGKKAETTVTVREEGPFLELIHKGQQFPPLPAEKNLVFLAAELFRSKTGLESNLEIELIKRIPPGSGLGGGSSNAATTLLVLNGAASNCKKSLSDEKILDLAAQLGSDVPFFVEIALQNRKKSPVRSVGGRGEIFRFLPPPPSLGILLAFPGFSSHTGKAFDLLDEKRQALPKKTYKDEPFKADKLWTSPANWGFYNDFEELFLNYGTETEKTAYKTILSELKKSGAVFTGLSGSGSACFGIFSGLEEAEQAKNKLKGTFFILQSTFFLAL